MTIRSRRLSTSENSRTTNQILRYQVNSEYHIEIDCIEKKIGKKIVKSKSKVGQKQVKSHNFSKISLKKKSGNCHKVKGGPFGK